MGRLNATTSRATSVQAPGAQHTPGMRLKHSREHCVHRCSEQRMGPRPRPMHAAPASGQSHLRGAEEGGFGAVDHAGHSAAGSSRERLSRRSGEADACPVKQALTAASFRRHQGAFIARAPRILCGECVYEKCVCEKTAGGRWGAHARVDRDCWPTDVWAASEGPWCSRACIGMVGRATRVRQQVVPWCATLLYSCGRPATMAQQQI